jgi:rSAM/selenodomain-associated transferase 2
MNLEPPTISIIIPTLNEEENLKRLLPHLIKMDKKSQIKEIIIADGGSQDQTIAYAIRFGAKIVQTDKGRAKQMNAGAKKATGEILHFIHADSFPPVNFTNDVLSKINEGADYGCFRSLFQTTNKFLRINSYFTRFKGIIFRGGGQTLFVKQALFNKAGGYNESLIVMEEYELLRRLRKLGRFEIIQKSVLVSVRNYEKNGYVRLQFIYACIFVGFFLGISQSSLTKFYKRFNNQGKI